MVLNGDILEYENYGLTADEEVAIAALIGLGAVINLVYPNLLRIRGGYDLTNRPALRQAIQMNKMDMWAKRANQALEENRQKIRQQMFRKKVSEYGPVLAGTVLVGRAAARLKWNPKRPAPPGYKDNYFGMVMRGEKRFRVAMSTREAKASMGYHMLAQKNATQRMFRSTLYYEMSPVLNKLQYLTSGIYVHTLKPGNGPHLYGTYIPDLKPNPQVYGTDTRNGLFGTLYGNDSGGFGSAPDATSRFIGERNTIYVFAVDWPFAIMNTDENTQVEPTNTTVQQGQCLRWAYYGWNTTSDMNIPRNLTFVVQNAAWTYLTHFQTTLKFSFYSTTTLNYTVELLFFRFKADVDTMNYRAQTQAPMDRQFDLDIYCNESTKHYNHEDITVIHRKRLSIPGLTQIIPYDATWRVTSEGGMKNEVRYQYVSKRQYVIKRPIVSTLNTSMSEKEFFDTYFDRQRGIYCRMQAWPTCPPAMVGADTRPFFYVDDVTLNCSQQVEGATRLGPGVGCFMSKISKWKLDQNVGN